MYDVIIIGKGPAGISASLYTVRANLRTLIIGKNTSVLKKAGKIENYYGFPGAISGEALLKAGEEQASGLGARIVEDEVIAIEQDGIFEVVTSEGKVRGKAVLLATGQPHKQIKIKDIEKFEGRGISYCTTCDGFFYRNLKAGVLGHKDYAIHEAAELETFTKDITIYTNGLEPDLTEKYSLAAERFKVNKNTIAGFEGAEFLEKVRFSDGTEKELDGMFIACESASSVDFARKLGVITDKNSVVVDKEQQTNIQGIFAAGDCTGGFKQISVSVGQGAIAGKRIIEYVRSLKKDEEVDNQNKKVV